LVKIAGREHGLGCFHIAAFCQNFPSFLHTNNPQQLRHGTQKETETMDDELAAPRLTVMDAFNKTSYFKKEPEIGFGTGSRPPLMIPTSTPGPGAYQLKSTLNKTLDSSIKSPEQYTIRSRHNFGDPNLKALSKTTANEPGRLSFVDSLG
jgi:hypothetical protein